ncbi:hypothetical protein E2C01_061663 [Portunus trituberculatus]|uniref:Uncharacterized protein n=1 Tax=Portunus trituberculatus TaxID=210409 RepID=A0A5B7HBV0_PORTR|nr:hypothetical protein [Portunus trituberculatus]
MLVLHPRPGKASGTVWPRDEARRGSVAPQWGVCGGAWGEGADNGLAASFMSLIHEMCFEWLTCLWFTVDVTYQICMVGPLCGCSGEIAAIMSHTRGTRAFEVRLRGPVSLSSLYTRTAGRPSSAGAGLGRLPPSGASLATALRLAYRCPSQDTLKSE